MIDEKKLIEELIKSNKHHARNSREESLLDRVIRIVKEQPQVANDTNVGSRREWYQKGYQDGLNADKWIPCSERLPSESGCYLVTTDGRYNDIIDIAFYHEEDEVWFKACKILAWTDLPHPYKKEGAE